MSLAAGTANANHPASRGVLLDFSATWCGPCQQMSPIVSRLKRQGYPVRKVDVDQERALAQQYNIRSIPAFVLVVDGKERMRYEGATSEGQLKRMLAQIPHDPKPSVIGNPDPRQTIGLNPGRALPRSEVQVAENTEPKSPAGVLGSFSFPFGGKKTAEPTPPAEPAVIRAKLDQDKPRPDVSLEENPLASSVRVRIAGKDGVNYGSGTIVESRPGRTVILTCGHIFRDLDPAAKIEVDLFTGSQAETFVGKTIAYDLEGDVGLLSIATDAGLPASRLASLADGVQVRQSVYSIGCGGGETPSREDVFVTALNRYLGPDNIECTGEPMQGRSGGGLFNAQGDVVGVCVAADPKDKRGLYAGLNVIHNLLGEHNFAHLIPKSSVPEAFAIANTAPETPQPVANVAPPTKAAVAKGGEASLPAALTNPGEAEVICIVRPINQPKSASQVVIINRASSRFVSYLTQELSEQPIPTVHHRPNEVQAKPELEPPPFAEPDELEAPPFATPAPTLERYRRRTP